ncbi:MAG: hypothetical protein ACLGJB_03665 [Blastocatellia bacterium]
MDKPEINSVCELVRKAEQDYITGTTTISKYVEVSQYETLNKIDAYLNSKHVSGETDSQGREKPFFNIVTAAVNIWYRATDIDRKNIKVKPTKSQDDIAAFLATVKLQDWMRKEQFGKFLNKWGRTLAKYGSAVTKFVEQGGKLHCLIIPWNRIICDTVDFYNNPVIEVLELTPAQLRRKEGYDQEMVQKLIDTVSARKTLEGQRRDNKNDYIKVYEVHGELPLSWYSKNEKDENKYQQQMYAVSFLESQKKGEYDDFVLAGGKEAKSPYQKDDLIEEDDQTLSIGAVQNLFEAQWMVNHTAKAIKDQLDLSSKLIFQTSDGNFVGQNALSAIENGDILIHASNQPLTQLANNSHDITALQGFSAQWQALGNQINGISEAMMGVNQPSGSAWRQTEALLQESHSLFELMTENKGLAIEEMLREFIIPHLKKQLDSSDEVSATLEAHNINKIDSLYVPNKAIRIGNEQMKKKILSGEIADQADFQGIAKEIQSDLSQQGNQRFFKPSDISSKTWKELFKDLEWDLEVDITGEQKDTQVVMETLNTALKIVASTPPERLSDPNFKLVFNKILEASSVISPLEIASVPPPEAPANKVNESLSYKDAPEDIKRQIEQQAGLQPSQAPSQPQKNAQTINQ